MRRFIIEEHQLQSILSYLSTRPWAEVNEAMHGLQRLPVYEEPKPDDDESGGDS